MEHQACNSSSITGNRLRSNVIKVSLTKPDSDPGRFLPGLIKIIRRPGFSALIVLSCFLSFSHGASAIPAFARQYGLSCNTCHAAFPRLNSFGKNFIESNYRLENWKEGTAQSGDDMLALPKVVPLALRVQAYVQSHQANNMDPATGAVANNAAWDFQSPYMIKLLSSAPLSDHISYYFAAIMSEQGANGTLFLDDAWISHDDLFGSGVDMQLGQFQVSDLMFSRETRLTAQDFLPYRMAGITYERGVTLGRDIGPANLALGVANGNGVDTSYPTSSAGYNRPEMLFDNNNSKSVFGRIGTNLGPVRTGLFGLTGKQPSGGTGISTSAGTRETDKRVVGLDVSGDNGQLYWFGQTLWNRWDNFLDDSPDVNRNWNGGFLGADYIYNDHWTYSLLYNRASAKDFRGTNTIYEGIELNTVTATASYYFMRNAKGIIEGNLDLQPVAQNNGVNFVGHMTKESYLLLGFDVAL
jgi:hypothetical protein